ncbi:phosphatase PAP2 family protein [Patescibacteria group bacterium]|nr:phosphatase PAP2 family protein [Patescibacteria group bacterium]
MIFIALSSALTARFVITGLIRLFKPRLRPFIDSNINLLIDKVNQQSFPSGHASFTFGLAMVVYLYNKKVGVLFFAGAFLVSTSRIFVGVHWPLDILAGAVVGIFSGWLISKLLKFKK